MPGSGRVNAASGIEFIFGRHPGETRIQFAACRRSWIPAFAGTTSLVSSDAMRRSRMR
jgi:hypothetical protein